MPYNSSTYCPLPFNHLHVEADSEIKACCIAKSFKKKLFLKDSNIDQIYNSEQFINLRNDLMNGVKNDICTSCWEKEDIGVLSGRQEHLGLGVFGTNTLKTTTLSDNGIVDTLFDSLDIRFSNVCNFKCIMCGPKNSHLHNENKVISIKDNFVQELKPHIGNVEEVYFAGGEPLAMTEHYELIQYLSEVKPDIKLVYSTNGSLLSKKEHNVLEYWAKFKNISLVISIDGLYEKGENIRKGLDTEKFINNIYKIQEYTKTYKNLDYGLCYTVGTYNVKDIYTFIQQVKDLKLIQRDDQMQFNNFVSYPSHYCIKNLNSKEKLEIKNTLLEKDFNKQSEAIQIQINEIIKFMVG